ncbi:MAG: hypothetical protein QXZ41_04650 [Ignisphaera sp.]|uniref:DUF2029 domain-containing protein n=1 Tax=Ignisphaera aggregans TaxID=334771 RepID=A0A7C4NIZ5_9CREN
MKIPQFNSKAFAFILTLALFVSATSFYLHMPEKPALLSNPGFSYSDIVYGLYNPIFLNIVSSNGLINNAAISEKWFNKEVALKLVRSRLCPIPYKDYKFEYPPIVAVFWYASTCLSIMSVFPESYSPIEYYELAKKAGEIHYYVQSLILIISLITTTIYMYRLTKILNTSWKRIVLFALLPSTIIYLIYNWDIITAMFTITSLYYLINKRYFESGILLGLSISTKLLPIIYAILVLYDLTQRSFNDKSYIEAMKLFGLGLVVSCLIPYLMMLTLSYEGFAYFIQHHAQWYCENCVYLLITKDIWNPYNRLLGMILVFLVVFILMSVDLDYNNPLALSNLLLASIISSTVLNYVFSPQMMLMITSIAVLTLGLKQAIFLVIADITNFGIITLFFKDAEARLWLMQNLGFNISANFSPWTLDSPVQILASIRNIILVLILIDIIYHLPKSK